MRLQQLKLFYYSGSTDTLDGRRKTANKILTCCSSEPRIPSRIRLVWGWNSSEWFVHAGVKREPVPAIQTTDWFRSNLFKVIEEAVISPMFNPFLSLIQFYPHKKILEFLETLERVISLKNPRNRFVFI